MIKSNPIRNVETPPPSPTPLFKNSGSANANAMIWDRNNVQADLGLGCPPIPPKTYFSKDIVLDIAHTIAPNLMDNIVDEYLK